MFSVITFLLLAVACCAALFLAGSAADRAEKAHLLYSEYAFKIQVIRRDIDLLDMEIKELREKIEEKS